MIGLKSIERDFEDLAVLNYEVIDKFYELYCAFEFSMEYIRVADLDQKKVKELNRYTKFLEDIFCNDKSKKISEFKKATATLKGMKNRIGKRFEILYSCSLNFS